MRLTKSMWTAAHCAALLTVLAAATLLVAQELGARP
jgi:hypothetical protein